MSKGLEALNALKSGYIDNEKVVITRKAFDKQVAIIEEELALAEQLKNAVSNGTFQNQWASNLIEKRNEKELEALEIIKKKGVDVDWLIYNFKFGSLDVYNCDFGLYKEDNWRILTEEEYEFLREVLL